MGTCADTIHKSAVACVRQAVCTCACDLEAVESRARTAQSVVCLNLRRDSSRRKRRDAREPIFPSRLINRPRSPAFDLSERFVASAIIYISAIRAYLPLISSARRVRFCSDDKVSVRSLVCRGLIG